MRMEKVAHITAKIRALRERSGMSMDDLAKKVDLKGASSFQRYEDASLFKDEYIKVSLAKKLAKALVGLGNPPITKGEVYSLAGISSLEAGVTEDLVSAVTPNESGVDKELLQKAIDLVNLVVAPLPPEIVEPCKSQMIADMYDHLSSGSVR